ncbi:single-stranded DNA-binding protein [Aeromicrobium massiliense]|uniref:single-stranded DNA-binding protein n=1 Tax=Aeromicrobium massiliense TaxID=1464554 RepID=UPI0002E39B73|nr:single-stranded DNA-binding protein [Aeromicrobium massiliense]
MFTSTVTIEGRLGQAPQVFDNLTEFVVLTNRRTQDSESGEWSNSDTTRYTVKTFKTLATRARDLESGEKVIVAGSIVTETWTDQTTQEARYKQVLLADAVGRSV